MFDKLFYSIPMNGVRDNQINRGNVITVDSGIYMPEGSPCDPKCWNIGVRIEDDVLITEGIPEVLSSCMPISITVIAAMVQEHPSTIKR
jgi:Xaa-Pro aminopeptidase